LISGEEGSTATEQCSSEASGEPSVVELEPDKLSQELFEADEDLTQTYEQDSPRADEEPALLNQNSSVNNRDSNLHEVEKDGGSSGRDSTEDETLSEGSEEAGGLQLSSGTNSLAPEARGSGATTSDLISPSIEVISPRCEFEKSCFS
jgi:hypothetical protein